MNELRRWLPPPEGKVGSLVSDVLGKQTKFVLGEGCSLGRSFEEILRSSPCFEVQSIGLKCWSSHIFDLHLVPAHLEPGDGKNEPCSAVACSMLEKPESRAHQVLPKEKRAPIPSLVTCPMLAADSTKMMKGISVSKWVKQQFGLFHVDWGLVFTGLLEGLLGGWLLYLTGKRNGLFQKF